MRVLHIIADQEGDRGISIPEGIGSGSARGSRRLTACVVCRLQQR